jgi:hypothetical protein
MINGKCEVSDCEQKTKLCLGYVHQAGAYQQMVRASEHNPCIRRLHVLQRAPRPVHCLRSCALPCGFAGRSGGRALANYWRWDCCYAFIAILQVLPHALR